MTGHAPLPQAKLGIGIQSLVVLLTMVSIYGCFWTPDSYLSMRADGDGTDSYAALPFPVTNIALVLISLTIGFFVFFIVRRAKTIKHSYIGYALTLLAFCTAAWSPEPGMTLSRALRLLPALGFAITFAQLTTLPNMLRLMSIALLLAAILSIFMAVAVPAYGQAIASQRAGTAWRGAMVQKNFTGFTFGIGLVLLWGAWRMRSIGTLFACFTAALCLLMLVKSGSATGLTAAAAGLAAAVSIDVVQRAASGIRLLLMVLILLCIVLLTLGILLAPEELFGALGRDATLTGRTQIWASVWGKIQAQPIRGYGWGFWVMENNPVKLRIWREVGDTAAHSHNTWLDVWLQLGLAGLVIALTMFVQLVSRLLKIIITTQRRDAGMFMGLAVFLIVRSFAEVEFTVSGFGGLFYLLWARILISKTSVDPLAIATLARAPGLVGDRQRPLHPVFGNALA